MRIVKRKEFMNMPAGTLFSKTGGPYSHSGEPIQILEDTCPEYNDFVSTELTFGYDMENKVGEFIDGKPVKGEIYTSRDGLYEGDEVEFIIYNRFEFDTLMDVLSRANPE